MISALYPPENGHAWADEHRTWQFRLWWTLAVLIVLVIAVVILVVA
ncbi:hypothetical protein [Mycobacterium colombiense]|nr:hypothetical protein [Mycobacterium colombiense]